VKCIARNLLGWVIVLALDAGVRAADYRVYSGCCDASAAVFINENLFAVASDEENLLRLYPIDGSGPPVRTVSTASFLGVGRRNEADLEGAAKVGGLVFWIGSHSRNSDGEGRPSRHVLFAMAVRGVGPAATLEPAGQPFRGLIAAMAADPALADLDLAQAARRGAEDPGGLNIEGIAAGPGDSLWIGFRNPVPGGRALLVPLLNPGAVIQRVEVPRFGAVRRLDLAGRGIRDIVNAGGRFFVLAGPAEGGGRHRLFVWDGSDGEPRELKDAVPKGFQAESMVAGNGSVSTLDLLSDDGSEKIGERRCENVADPSARQFRAFHLEL
jgi:hypothetical protein